MRHLPTYEEFHRDVSEASMKEDSNEEIEEPSEDEDGDRFKRWLARKKDRMLASQEALRPSGSIAGQYGNSMQYGSTL